MNSVKKAISVLCVVALLCGALSCISLAADEGYDYKIANPYDGVDWSWKQYKTDLHSHTTASDGNDNLKDMLEKQYSYGFDDVAVTDHGTVSYSWTEQKIVEPLKVFLSAKRPGAVVPLDENGGTAANGNPYALRKTADTEYYYQIENGVDGHEMMRVPFGIENNPSSLNNAHVNSWFVDYGHGYLGGTSDYETPIKNVDALGGLSVINHPGEYTNARDEDETADAYDVSNTHYAYVVDKFTSLLTKYPTCIGIDVNSKGDTRTRYDRKLWDILLMNVVPTGRNVFAIGSSDAHSVDAVYTGFVKAVMPENTPSALKNCLSNGQFFACSKNVGNPEEITDIAFALNETGNKTATLLAGKLIELQKNNPKAKYESDKSVDVPEVYGISVDDVADTIAIRTNGLCVRWIANGKTIAYGNSIDLDDYKSQIGSYVRAEIFGAGGIVYSQPFTLDYNEAPLADNNDGFIDLWMLASVIPDTIVRFIASLPIFGMIWKWIESAN